MQKISKLETFVCSLCKKKHNSEEDAVACYDKCERSNEHKLKVQNRRKELQELCKNSATVEELVKNISAAVLEIKGHDPKLKIIRNAVFGAQSCSHNAPKGCKTNWCARDKDLPTSYLGFSLIVSYEMGKVDWTSLTWLFGEFGLHTNSGSPSSHQATIFLQDFPVMQEEYERSLVAQRDLFQFRAGLCQSATEEFLSDDANVEKMREISRLGNQIEELRKIQYQLIAEATAERHRICKRLTVALDAAKDDMNAGLRMFKVQTPSVSMGYEAELDTDD